jgi:ribonuclease D
LSHDVTLIHDPAALDQWLLGTRGHAELALDTEADGMFRYRARLCYVQLAAGDAIAIVDTLAVPVQRLAALLARSEPIKLIHDLAFDARMLAEYGVALGPVFDTSIAARFLGIKATGLKSLLASELGVDLDKSFQQADWGARPLPEAALPYLADDVRHLARLRAVLTARAEAADIHAEIAEECAYALREAARPRPQPSAFSRIPNTRELTPRARARLHLLAELRERLAEARDVPAGKLIPTAVLVASADSGSVSDATLGRFLAGDEQLAYRQALSEGDALQDAPEGELVRLYVPPPPPYVVKLQKRRRALLVGFRDRAAAERGIDPQAVIPGHCINELVTEDVLDADSFARVPGFGARRTERYAEPLVRELGPSWSDA